MPAIASIASSTERPGQRGKRERGADGVGTGVAVRVRRPRRRPRTSEAPKPQQGGNAPELAGHVARGAELGAGGAAAEKGGDRLQPVSAKEARALCGEGKEGDEEAEAEHAKKGVVGAHGARGGGGI